MAEDLKPCPFCGPDEAALRAEVSDWQKTAIKYEDAHRKFEAEVERLKSVASKVMDFAVENDELRKRERRYVEALEKIANREAGEWLTANEKIAREALSPAPGSQEADHIPDVTEKVESIREKTIRECAEIAAGHICVEICDGSLEIEKNILALLAKKDEGRVG